MRNDAITSDLLRERLMYDPETGLFRWRIGGSGYKANQPAGSLKQRNSYVRIWFDGKRYCAHRLAWLFVYGRWPELDIDHINGNPADNRICNLREATVSQNIVNSKLRSDNSSGYKGIYFCRRYKRWKARLRVSGRCLRLGSFHTKEQAAAAYDKAALLHYGAFARNNQALARAAS
jgi:hypothetical protein